MQCVKRMKEFFLDPLLARQELHVINQQHIGLPVFLAKPCKLMVLDAFDVFVGKLFARNVRHACLLAVPRHMVPNSVQQMRLAQTNPAIHKQRVIGFTRRLSHGQRGSVRKTVVVADNECVELVFRVKTKFRAVVVFSSVRRLEKRRF